MSVRKVAMACSVCGHRNYFIPEKKGAHRALNVK